MFDRPSYNHIQESTGANGSLPDAEHDINCPALGQPEYKLNYLSTACESRLVTKVRGAECTFGKDCPRFKGPDPKKRIYVSREHDKEEKPGRKAPTNVQECMSCHETKQIKAIRLCNLCYAHNHHAGTLENFAKYRQRVKRVKT
jgi:hypothetical protein